MHAVASAIAIALPWILGPAADPDASRSYAGPDDAVFDERGTTSTTVATDSSAPEPSETAAPLPTSETPRTTGGRRRIAPAKTPKFLRPLTLRGETLKLGGYLQPGFVHVNNTQFYPDDQDGFDFANARVTGSGRHRDPRQRFLAAHHRLRDAAA